MSWALFVFMASGELAPMADYRTKYACECAASRVLDTWDGARVVCLPKERVAK